jgi:hypothetical protein
MSEMLTGKIAAIVDDRHVVINRGKLHGVQVGQKFEISMTTPDIVDPDDPSNRLPGLRFNKGQLKVSKIFDKMSFCAIVPKQESSVSNLFGITIGGIVEIYPKVVGAMVSDDDWKIRVGDDVSLDE